MEFSLLLLMYGPIAMQEIYATICSKNNCIISCVVQALVIIIIIIIIISNVFK